jgi:hypothetical protein
MIIDVWPKAIIRRNSEQSEMTYKDCRTYPLTGTGGNSNPGICYPWVRIHHREWRRGWDDSRCALTPSGPACGRCLASLRAARLEPGHLLSVGSNPSVMNRE